jgi:16S rRNA G1207 methylase RsmC
MVIRIIKYLENNEPKRIRHVADLGCGWARVGKYFENNNEYKFYNYDHIAVDETVREQDISNLDLEDGEVDIAILCLAMWGDQIATIISLKKIEYLIRMEYY